MAESAALIHPCTNFGMSPYDQVLAYRRPQSVTHSVCSLVCPSVPCRRACDCDSIERKVVDSSKLVEDYQATHNADMSARSLYIVSEA